jgi:methionyl-tRNA synthetase
MRAKPEDTMNSLKSASNERGGASFLSTALPYVNAPPHVGHALEAVIGDALARHLRQRGADLRFTGGTDDHALKNVRAARVLGVEPRRLVETNGAVFRGLATAVGATFDDYLHTSSDPRHAPAVVELWQRCAERGDVYTKDYSGHYCSGCEAFLSEAEREDGLCPVHRAPLEETQERNWFFRLSRYRGALIEALDSGRLRVIPEERAREVRRFVADGLIDFSISRHRTRALDFGIGVPGDPSQVVYVWFDALGNYLSQLGFPEPTDELDRYWLRSFAREHLIGKDILRFHAIYWPAILLSAGLPLPTAIRVHGYVTVDGAKIGKSLGNTIDPFALALRHGTTALRYYLLRHLHTTKDGDFRESRLVEAHDSELAGKLGNLLQRVTALASVYSSELGLEPAVEEVDFELESAACRAFDEVKTHVDAFALHTAIGAIFELVSAANRYADSTAPWLLAKHRATDRSADRRLGRVLAHLCESVRVIAVLLAPFLPGASARLLERLGLPPEAPDYERARYGLGGPFRPRTGPPIFPRLRGTC